MAFDGTNPCWKPRVPIADKAKRRFRKAQLFSGGYQQRITDGLNSVERSWSLLWEIKPKADLMAMSAYLAARRGYAFPFQHPVTGAMHSVYCDEWSVDWNVSMLTTDPALTVGAYSASARYGTMSAEFRKANGAAILPYPQWVPDPSEIPAVFALDFVNNRSWDRFAGADDAEGQITVTRASIGMVSDTSYVWRVVQADKPRRSNRGLLIERASTNAIRNSTFIDAVPGTPGTQPTSGWAAMTTAGLTYSIVGTGKEDGVDYIDIRWVGTNTSGAVGALGLYYTPNTSAVTPVAIGEVWTASTFVRLVGGDYTYIDDITDPLNPVTHTILNSGVVVWEAIESGAAQGAGITKTLYNATDDDLSRQRIAATRTVSVALTTRIFMQYRMDLPVNAMCDITLRFGLPQLEKVPFATSPIPTTNAVLLRAADAVTLHNPGRINGGSTTIYAQFNPNATAAARLTSAIVPFSWRVNASNYQTMYIDAVSGFANAQNYVAGVNDFAQGTLVPVLTDTAKHKMAFATATDNAILAKDGALSGVDTTLASIAGAATTINIGGSVGTYYLDGYVQEVAYWPQRLTAAQLKELTSV